MPRKSTDAQCGLIAAYREGLGLAAIVLINSGGKPHVLAAAGDRGAAAEGVRARWWCRRAGDAERIAAAARRNLRRVQEDDSDLAAGIGASVLAAARRYSVLLQSDEEIADDAMQVVARIDAEMQKLQQSGGLKSVNRAYKEYRLEISGRGERILRYGEWMLKYRENLVRQAAAALRDC